MTQEMRDFLRAKGVLLAAILEGETRRALAAHDLYVYAAEKAGVK